MYKSLFVLFVIPLLSGFYGGDDIVNYYNIPTELEFDEVKYNLSWSTHPNDTYYKQEYLPRGEKLKSFTNMILMDFIMTEMTIKEVVHAQLSNLAKRKETDAICNFSVIKNPETNEYILDFLMSDGNASKPEIIEWNAYRYKEYTVTTGHKGILLFGVSRRAYRSYAMQFLKDLKTLRAKVMSKISKYPTPEINIK